MIASLRATLVALLACLMACGDDAASEGEARRAEASEAASTPARAEPLYDENGDLLESDRTVAGLRLPRGLDTILEDDRLHIYETRVPITKVHRYFGPRLVTGEVDELGSGAAFRSAIPRGARGAVVRLDVSILAVGRSLTRITVHELPTPPTNPPPEPELVRQLNEDLRQLD